MPDLKITGKNFPTPADPGGRVCFSMEIPDAMQYKAAVMGQVEWMADWRCWLHTSEDYPDPPAINKEVAELFAEAVANATWDICMDFCERMAQCLTDQNEALMIALAGALTTNQLLLDAIASGVSENGGAIPGKPLTTSQTAQDISPDNVRDEDGNCILNKAWGASFYMIQRGDEDITDLFEQLESRSNTLERAQLAVDAIPAVGGTIAAAPAFADQLLEEVAEGYAAASTTEFREQLACDMFCIMRENCELTIDDIIGVLQTRLGTLEFNDFQAVMEFVIAGSFSGAQIAEVAYLLYFTAMRFGQQFGDMIGIRPLTDIMGLGAQQFNNAGWETLCDCPDQTGTFVIDFETGENVDFVNILWGDYEPGVGVHQEHDPSGSGYLTTIMKWTTNPATVISHFEVEADYNAGVIGLTGDYTWYFRWGPGAPLSSDLTTATPTFPETWDGSSAGGLTDDYGVIIMCDTNANTLPTGSSLLKRISIDWSGVPPA